MAYRMKEEEKNEKIIRGLLKLPANKRCINCNSLGPQYVCINFWSFICTNCSGLHREFTHRVKSISMAKFTSQEVNALQGGGNERAREIYFKDWDPQRHSYPDSSNLDRLRDFIKHVYVERRYAGGKNIDVPPKVQVQVQGEQDDYDENRSFKTDRSGSRSPPYNDPYEKHFGERPGSARSDDRNSRLNYEARSPVYDQGDHKNPNHFEMRNEIPRDDKAGNDVQSPKSYRSRTSEELPKPGVSDHQKSVYISSPPMVRPVRDILGGDIPPLRVGELPKMNGGKASNSTSETQSSNSSKGPNNGNSVELKRVNSGSLIDFSADSEPSTFGAVKESVPPQTGSTPANGGGWASFDISSQQKAPEAASTAGNLESEFAQLFVNAPTPVVAPAFPPATSTSSLPISNNSGQWPAAQQQPSSFQVSNHSTNPPVHATVPAQLVDPFPSTVQGEKAVLDGQSSHPVMHLSHQRTIFGNSQNSLDAEPSGRKELPADLFTGVYSTSSASYPAWRMGPHHGMVYQMQYPVRMATTYGASKQSAPTFHTPVSTNPFDLGNESASAPNYVINPSASLPAIVPNIPLSSTNSPKFAAAPSQWTPQQQFPYPPSTFPGPYMMQQFPHDMPRQPSTNFFPAVNRGGIGSEAIPYGASNSSQSPARTNSSVPSTGGNPFG